MRPVGAFMTVIGMISLLVTASVASLNAASAAAITTADLYAICGKSDGASQAACKFYVLGAAEGAEISWMSGQRRPLFCVPSGVTSITLAHAFIQSAALQSVDRPDVGGVSAVATVLYALEHEYPCERAAETSSPTHNSH